MCRAAGRGAHGCRGGGSAEEATGLGWGASFPWVPSSTRAPCPGSALPHLICLAAPLLPLGVRSKSHALDINGRQLWHRGNDSTWSHRTCVPVSPLPGAELGARGPVSSLEKGSDNSRDLELLKAPPSQVCDAQGILPSTLKRGGGEGARLFPALLRPCSQGRPGPPWVCQSPAALWDARPLGSDSLFVLKPFSGQVSWSGLGAGPVRIHTHSLSLTHAALTGLYCEQSPFSVVGPRRPPRSRRAETPRPRGARDTRDSTGAAGGAGPRQGGGVGQNQARVSAPQPALAVPGCRAGHFQTRQMYPSRGPWAKTSFPALQPSPRGPSPTPRIKGGRGVRGRGVPTPRPEGHFSYSIIVWGVSTDHLGGLKYVPSSWETQGDHQCLTLGLRSQHGHSPRMVVAALGSAAPADLSGQGRCGLPRPTVAPVRSAGVERGGGAARGRMGGRSGPWEGLWWRPGRFGICPRQTSGFSEKPMSGEA